MHKGPPALGGNSPATDALGKPHQLAESVLELQQAMEPLTSFTYTEVSGQQPTFQLGQNYMSSMDVRAHGSPNFLRAMTIAAAEVGAIGPGPEGAFVVNHMV